jgi:hypothetical protein
MGAMAAAAQAGPCRLSNRPGFQQHPARRLRLKRAVLGSVAAVGLVASLFLAVAAPPAQAVVLPNDQVTVAVAGSITSMTSTPSFRPNFDPSIPDYAIYCQSGVNVVTFQFGGGVTPRSAQVGLGENQLAEVHASNGTFWIRCLPHDFPVLQVTGSASAAPGWYLTGNLPAAPTAISPGSGSSPYAIVLDSHGTPVWYQNAPGGAINTQAFPNDTVGWMPLNGPGIGVDPTVGYGLHHVDTQTTDTVKAAVLPTDPHEMLAMSNGDYMLIGTPIRQMAVTYQGVRYQEILDCVVQEVNSRGALVWWWRASDHVSPGEALHANPTPLGTRVALDVYHCNSVDVDASAAHVLVSMRAMSALYLIPRTQQTSAGTTLVQDGRLTWKLNGCGNTQTGNDHEPVLVVQQQTDPEACFDAQHDARFQPNGDIALYDDHTYQQGGGARGVEYSIAVGSRQATYVGQFPTSPTGPNASATGNFRRYPLGTPGSGGSDNLVGWGFRPGSGFSEWVCPTSASCNPTNQTDPTNQPVFSVTYPKGDLEYRAVKVPLNALSADKLRAAAGVPRPTFPTVNWQSLGGGVTAKPAVAAWSPNRLDAFVRGTDGQLWHKWWTGTRWSGWESLGGQLAAGSGPAVAAWSPGRLDVFVEGTDHQLWHRWFDSAGWHAWEGLGGTLASGPAASSWSAGRLDIVATGPAQTVLHKWFSTRGWSGWESLGGQTTAEPGIASWAAGRVDVFIQGAHSQLWHSWYDSKGWHAWENLGGNLTTGPAAASLGVGLVDAVAAGAAQEPERLPFNSGWQFWQPLLKTTEQPPSVVPFNGGEDVFVAGSDGGLWFGSVSATGKTQGRAAVASDAIAGLQAVNKL